MQLIQLMFRAFIYAALASPAFSQGPAGKMERQEEIAARDAAEILAYFQKARTNWAEGKRDEAVFWLYVAQLSFRASLAAYPDQDPTGAPALFGSLMETVGRPINEYAFGDIPQLLATIDRALAFDEAHANRSIPDAVHRQTRAGLIVLHDEIKRTAEVIRKQRTANNLENR